MTTAPDPDAVALYGEERPRRRPVQASAGPLTFVLEDGMIKHIRLGSVELVRRVYFGVRDDTWDTIYPVLSDLQVESDDDTFRASFKAACRNGTVDYTWVGTIEGEADGLIRFTATGTPHVDFGSNRIGLCLLLSGESLAGEPFELIKTDGSAEAGTFPPFVYPTLVGAQFTGIRYRSPGGPKVACEMEGAVFDMEDQRLYMETTYKAYAPLPHDYTQIRAGETFTQVFTLRLLEEVEKVAAKPITIEIDQASTQGSIPLIGLTLPTEQAELLNDREIAEARQLQLGHTRIELDAHDNDVLDRLRAARPAADQLAPGVLLSIHNVDENRFKLVSDILDACLESALKSVMLETCDMGVSLLPALREAVGDGVDIGGPGSQNVSAHPHLPDWGSGDPDFLCWAGSAAIHQEDDETLMENTAGITLQCAAARQYAPYVALGMGPFSLDGVWPRPCPTPRYMGQFAATWVASAVKHLAEAGVGFATLFNVLGPEGVLCRKADHAEPRDNTADLVRLPAFGILAWLNGHRGDSCVSCRSSEPLWVEGLALAGASPTDGPVCLLINKTFEKQVVRITGLSGTFTVSRYDGSEAQWQSVSETVGADDRSSVTLEPYGLACLSP